MQFYLNKFKGSNVNKQLDLQIQNEDSPRYRSTASI